MGKCISIGCNEEANDWGTDLCNVCYFKQKHEEPTMSINPIMSELYPKYYKKVGNLKEVDTYAVHYLFNLNDPSGALQHASKKILLSGVRTGGKTQYTDIKEARDTLNRWLELSETCAT